MLPLLLLLACPAEEEPEICDAELVSATPSEASGPWATRTPIEVAFGGTASDVAFSVEGPDGAIAGAVSLEDGVATFQPDAPYPSEAEIRWEATACESALSGTFTTGTLEESVAAEEVEDRSYAMDLANATWLEPEDGGDMMEQLFGGVLLLGIEAAAGVELDVLGAVGEATASGGWQQDPCFATIDFEPVDFTRNPYFELTSDVMELAVDGVPAKIYNVRIEGGLTADRVVEGSFEGEADLRDYEDMLGSDPCAVIEYYAGITCQACTSDGEIYCVPMHAVDVEGERVQGLKVVPNENPEECTEEE